MPYKGTIRLNGKEYHVEVIAGQRYVNGMPAEEFLKTINIVELADLAKIGKQAIVDEKRGTKPNKYQDMLDRDHIKRNN